MYKKNYMYYDHLLFPLNLTLWYVQIAADTPTRKIKALHTWLQKFAKSKDKAEGKDSKSYR